MRVKSSLNSGHIVPTLSGRDFFSTEVRGRTREKGREGERGAIKRGKKKKERDQKNKTKADNKVGIK